MIIWMSFLAVGWVPVYFVMLFFIRDVVVSNIRICLAKHNIVLAARFSGKIKAIAQAGAQLVLVVFHLSLTNDIIATVQLPTVLLAALVTVYSLFDYGWGFYQLVKEKPAMFE